MLGAARLIVTGLATTISIRAGIGTVFGGVILRVAINPSLIAQWFKWLDILTIIFIILLLLIISIVIIMILQIIYLLSELTLQSTYQYAGGDPDLISGRSHKQSIVLCMEDQSVNNTGNQGSSSNADGSTNQVDTDTKTVANLKRSLSQGVNRVKRLLTIFEESTEERTGRNIIGEIESVKIDKGELDRIRNQLLEY